MKDSESKMKFLGYDTFKLRWTGYVMMSILCALAGSMYAINYGFVNPSITEPARSAEVLVATLIGGGGVYGPVLGTLAFIGIKDLSTSLMEALFNMQNWELPVGIFIIIICFKFKGGVWGTLQTIGAKIKGKRA
jgi:branched-chain amino acid transport system permease protein